jgi:uncharacterized protein YlxW (UPF0749 family)
MQSLYEENMELRDLLRHYKSSINVLNDQLMELTKERNKYRSQAIMRQNRIEDLLNGKENNS